ncbi:ion channel [Croceicoccus gelatinilyticus]|uniref:ion channel n=1 Tax=Croceicoccus gelatinilyticus TaxID=2835536 RepID=UPI001BCF4228|nr:two pore domain potassium channel family protein [Croceicoccus gelatinilyticus]
MDEHTVQSIHILMPQLASSTAMIMACVTVHGLGLALLTHFVNPSESDQRVTHLPPVSFHGIMITLAIVYGLFILHGIEIWMFALFFRAVGALPTLESAIYYSTISYGAIGYDDVAMASDWRIVGALEGICGIILLGWSTAYFVRILGRLDIKKH